MSGCAIFWDEYEACGKPLTIVGNGLVPKDLPHGISIQLKFGLDFGQKDWLMSQRWLHGNSYTIVGKFLKDWVAIFCECLECVYWVHDDCLMTSCNHASSQLVAQKEQDHYPGRERLQCMLGPIIDNNGFMVSWEHSISNTNSDSSPSELFVSQFPTLYLHSNFILPYLSMLTPLTWVGDYVAVVQDGMYHHVVWL